MGYAHGVGLEAQPEQVPVPVVGWVWVGDLEVGDVGRGECNAAEPVGFQPNETSFHRVRSVGSDYDDPHGFVEQGTGYYLVLLDTRVGCQLASVPLGLLDSLFFRFGSVGLGL